MIVEGERRCWAMVGREGKMGGSQAGWHSLGWGCSEASWVI